ncbi:hypothetical protein AAVH_03416 [Aphelenchoides avenae]|nr:hypothetical protein AAVH_03416 [Aphelenchus avenae]
MSSARSISSRGSRTSTSKRVSKVVRQQKRSVPPDQYGCCTAFFWIVVYAWIWMLIRSWALTAVIGVTVFWEESRPSSEAQEVNDEDHNFEVRLCLSLAFWTIMFITSVTEVTNINCVRSSTFYMANAALEFLALIVFAVSFAYHIYVLPADQYQQQYSDDDIFISGRLLSVVGVAILLLIATLPYPVLLLNVYRSKDRFESTESKRHVIR